MNTLQWTVWTANGEEWGHIRRLIIDTATRQIDSVDATLMENGRFVRVSWASFVISHEGRIVLSGANTIKMTTLGASGSGLPETPTLEFVSH